MEVDLILLSRDLSPPRDDVWRGIKSQAEVDLRVHRLAGQASSGRRQSVRNDRTSKKPGEIAGNLAVGDVPRRRCRARPRVRRAGSRDLERRIGFAALGADSAGEMASEWQNWDYPRHVGMAATLFRRERLERLTFRWEPGKCECRCCCDDLRRAGFGIGYLPMARAWHRSLRHAVDPRIEPARAQSCRSSPACESAAQTPNPGGRILTAFDRNHFLRFRRQFLTTLRASGNREPLSAVTYGLHAGERSILEAAGVHVFAKRENGVSSALSRLRDFQEVVDAGPKTRRLRTGMPAMSSFKGVSAPLWDLVRRTSRAPARRARAGRNRREPGDRALDRSHSGPGRAPPDPRAAAGRCLSSMPDSPPAPLATCWRYLREGSRLLETDLQGVQHWGDQVAMGHYLHHNPEAWHEIDDGWNYCIIFRSLETYRITPGGRVKRVDGSSGARRARERPNA